MMNNVPKNRDELNKLVAEYAGSIKRPMSMRYRWQMPSGKLGGKLIPRKVTYCQDAYRADKKRGTACGGPIGSTVTTAKVRD